MTRLNDDELRSIREREQAATPGPWVHGTSDKLSKWAYDVAWYHGLGMDERDHYTVQTAPGVDYRDRQAPSECDAEFIAHAREDVPALLAHASALQEEVGLLRTGLLQVQAFASNINVPVPQEQILGQVLKLTERALGQAEAGTGALLAHTTALQTEIADLKAHLKECHETWGECSREDCSDWREG